MKNTSLLESLVENRILQHQLRPGGIPGIMIDRFRLCGYPMLMRDLGQALAARIVSMVGAEGDMPMPNIIAARSFKSGLFAQWVMEGLVNSGSPILSFRWSNKRRDTYVEFVEPEVLAFKKGSNVLICSIDLHEASARKIGFYTKLICRTGAKVIGTASAFNTQGVAAGSLGMDRIISLFSNEELFQAIQQTAKAAP